MTQEDKIHITADHNGKTYSGWLHYGGVPAQVATLNNGVKPMFPDHLSKHLHVEDKQDHWVITMNTYLAPETFKAIDTIIRTDYKGKYEPASKVGNGNQHWTIPKVTQE